MAGRLRQQRPCRRLIPCRAAADRASLASPRGWHLEGHHTGQIPFRPHFRAASRILRCRGRPFTGSTAYRCRRRSRQRPRQRVVFKFAFPGNPMSASLGTSICQARACPEAAWSNRSETRNRTRSLAHPGQTSRPEQAEKWILGTSPRMKSDGISGPDPPGFSRRDTTGKRTAAKGHSRPSAPKSRDLTSCAV